MEGENESLTEENRQMKVTVEDLTKERNEIASKYQYLQLKSGASMRKGGNTSSISILGDDLRNTTNQRSALHISNNEEARKEEQHKKQVELL